MQHLAKHGYRIGLMTALAQGIPKVVEEFEVERVRLNSALERSNGLFKVSVLKRSFALRIGTSSGNPVTISGGRRTLLLNTPSKRIDPAPVSRSGMLQHCIDSECLLPAFHSEPLRPCLLNCGQVPPTEASTHIGTEVLKPAQRCQ